ncbi:AI-2E family transporter [Microvirga terrestris]|uniref:AI-2E family transporter n=1 Tax=Microvirga terrestris TaxID=2791024 RepID=A0ABS0HS98_9HYPH|nr:AI-2E family transporter [Microvirga terrestris]MBF9196097.1 AI-2E family transporter [Microvirga terrestris]
MREKAPASAPRHPDGDAPDARGRRATRLVGATALLALTLWMIRSYLTALGWAVIVTISVWPLYRRIRASLGGSHRAAPLLVTASLAALLVIPMTLALAEIGREGQFVVEWLTDLQQNGLPMPDWIHRLPLIGQHLDAWWQTHLARPPSAGQVLNGLDSATLTQWSETLGGAVLTRLLHGFLIFLTLFILLRNGDEIGDRVLAAVDRWFGRPGERLAEDMASAVRGTVNGTILVAVGEGILIGLGFVVAGVPNAALFAILTTAFAMLPMGAWLAFGTAAVVLVMTGGSIAAAGGVFGWGAAVMLVGDNIVQPALIGGAVRLPFLWTLLGILGGLETFGLIGLFVGPVLMAALLTIWRQQGSPSPATATNKEPP